MATILHVISGLGRGGAETMLLQLAARLHSRSHPQHVISLGGRGALADAIESHGIEVTDLSIKSTFGAIGGIIRLRGIVERIAPDVVQGWMYHGNLAATFAHLSVRQSRARRLYWSLRASNMDSDRYGGVIGWNARLSRFADLIIVNSRAGAAFHGEKGFDTRRFEIVPNGIDTDRFRPDPAAREKLRASHGIDPNGVVIIHVARVDRMKDHESFLGAMRSLPNHNAILVGSGTEALSLPPNVRALGPRADAERLYPAADIVVSSSAFGEGFSNTIAEGMSSGLVPVATDVGDASLIVGTTGKIVPPGDSHALAASIAEMASLAPSDRQKRGHAAREHIVKNFGILKAVETFERAYSNQLQDR